MKNQMPEIRYESKWRKGHYLSFSYSSDNLDKLLKYVYKFQIKENGKWKEISPQNLKNRIALNAEKK